MDDELNRAQQVVSALGGGELWSAAVALGDALTEYHRVLHRVRNAPVNGEKLTREEWQAISYVRPSSRKSRREIQQTGDAQRNPENSIPFSRT